MKELKMRILDVTSSGNPLLTVYSVCAELGERQQGSKQKFYVRVYRAMEQLVDEDQLTVARGTRDPSVYFNLNRLTK